MRRELCIQTIQEPREGLLGEVYQAVLSMRFNAASQSKILNHIRQGDITDPLGLTKIIVRQEREDRYLLCGGFRHYQLLRAANADSLTAKICGDDIDCTALALSALRQGVIAVLAYDCTTRDSHPQLRELKRHLDNDANSEIYSLVYSDIFLRETLKISASDMRRVENKQSKLDLLVAHLQKSIK